MKNNFKKQIFIDNVQMDTQTSFIANGDINIYPCSWEDDKVVTNGKRVRYRAGIEVDADGRTRVKRYYDGMNGPKLQVLHETTHGIVKMTRPRFDKTPCGIRRRMDKEYLYIKFKFPKKMGLTLMKALYADESDEMMSFLKTRKEETIWE